MPLYTRDALERRLCRWMLAMTPAQRLDLLSDSVNAILEVYGEAAYDLPEPYASRKAENELRIMKIALEEQRRPGISPVSDPPTVNPEQNKRYPPPPSAVDGPFEGVLL
jgi:hypothetical protein